MPLYSINFPHVSHRVLVYHESDSIQKPDELNTFQKFLMKYFPDECDPERYCPFECRTMADSSMLVVEPDVWLNDDGSIQRLRDFKKDAPVWKYWQRKLKRESPQQVTFYYMGEVVKGEEIVKFTSSYTKEDYKTSMLEDSLEFINHSPDGFAWGYAGSGPAQLAFAILLREFADPHIALKYYQEYANDFLMNQPKDGFWTTDSEEIRSWVALRYYQLEQVANELGDEVLKCFTPMIQGGPHWVGTSNEEISELCNQLKYKAEIQIDKNNFIKINISQKHCPEHIGATWQVEKICNLLTDFNPKNLKFVMRPYSNHTKAVHFRPKDKLMESCVTVLGAYKNVWFHVNLLG